MELERPRASSFAHAIVHLPAALAPTASVTPVAPVAPAIVLPPAPLASVIPPRFHSTIEISDDEDTAVSHSPITISDDEEEEIAPVRRLPAVGPSQSSVIPPVAPPVRLVPLSATNSHLQVESSGQVGGSKTQKHIEFDETDCRLVFRKALLCKTFTPQDEYADLNTVLYSFREVIRRELVPILAAHPGVKAWIGLTNLYDYHNKGVDRELSIKTPQYTLGQRLASLLS